MWGQSRVEAHTQAKSKYDDDLKAHEELVAKVAASATSAGASPLSSAPLSATSVGVGAGAPAADAPVTVTGSPSHALTVAVAAPTAVSRLDLAPSTRGDACMHLIAALATLGSRYDPDARPPTPGVQPPLHFHVTCMCAAGGASIPFCELRPPSHLF